MSKVKILLVMALISVTMSSLAQVGAQQTATPVPPLLPTEINTVTGAAGYRTYNMPDIGSLEYPLAFYSVSMENACVAPDGGQDIWFPGVIRVQPNDSVIYGVQFDTAYRIQIAMTEAAGELDASMLGTGPLMQYEPDAFDPNEVMNIDLNGVPAVRVDNLPVGPSGMVTMDIITVIDGRMIEILVEPVAEVGGTAVDGLEMVTQIINSLVLDDLA